MNEKLKVYFACAIRGEQGGAEEKKLIVGIIQDLGHEVLSEIFLGQNLHTNDLAKMDPTEICDRDLNWIEQADVIVADVSRISLGVGLEIGWKVGRGGRVVALCHEDRFHPLSNMIKGLAQSKYVKPGQVSIHTWPGINQSNILKKILTDELGTVK